MTMVGYDENAITCETLASTGNVEIGLQNMCSGNINSCPFFYLSVQSDPGTTTTLTATCTGM